MFSEVSFIRYSLVRIIRLYVFFFYSPAETLQFLTYYTFSFENVLTRLYLCSARDFHLIFKSTDNIFR